MKSLLGKYSLRALFLSLLSVVFFTQVYAGPTPVDPTLVWKEVDGVRIPIPPKVHPRLYLRSGDIPELRQRRVDPALTKVWKELTKLASDSLPKKEPAQKDWRYYFDQRGVTVRAELDALAYLTDGDPKVARHAIVSVLDTLEKAQYPKVNDISRAIGRIMISGAIVYDWCYDQLSDSEKTRFVKAFVRLASQLECGYPPTHGSSVTGHVSEWMLMRDLLSVSIAIYDEYPEMYNLTAGRFFKEHLPVRNWLYEGHNHHQGSSYVNVRFTNEMFAQWIFNRMGAGDVFNPAQQYVLYGVIYLRRPDGQVFPSGDVNHTRKKMKTYALPAFLAASYYKDEYLNYEAMLDTDVENQCKIFDFLWRDTRLGTKSPIDLPLTRYFSTPFGWMTARTGWDDRSVIAEMKINEYNFSNHQHLDAGAFQIYYKGPLAIDAGTYQGTSGGYNSPHNKNFFKRTIAHNSLLVFDPKESFKSSGYGGEDKSASVDNDGGQRLPGIEWEAPRDLKEMLEGNFRTGEVLAKGFGPDPITPDYSYLKGDITKAYSDKVKEVKRSFLFINRKQSDIPAVVIVFDRVVASDPSFKKYWLLHSIEKPEVNGSQTIIRRTKNGDSGALVCQTLLPKPVNAQIETVGGEGKEFWVFGKNYPNKSTRTADEAGESGAWRVEISPKAPSAEDRYLQVMQVTDTQVKSYLPVQHTSVEGVEAVRVGNHLATFSSDSKPIDRSFSLTVGGKESVVLVLTDLQPGTWRLQKGSKVIGSPIKVKAGEGVLTIRVEPGKYRITR